MSNYKNPKDCITTESIKEDNRRNRLKLYLKIVVMSSLILRLLQELLF